MHLLHIQKKILLKLWLFCIPMLPLLSPALLTSCFELHCALQTECICPSLQLLQRGKTRKWKQDVPKGHRRGIELQWKRQPGEQERCPSKIGYSCILF